MGGQRSSATTGAGSAPTAPTFRPGTSEWAEAGTPDWVKEAVASATTSQEIGQVRRRWNRAYDNRDPSTIGFKDGPVQKYLDEFLESKRSSTYRTPTAAEAREQRIFTTVDSSGRRRARRRG